MGRQEAVSVGVDEVSPVVGGLGGGGCASPGFGEGLLGDGPEVVATFDGHLGGWRRVGEGGVGGEVEDPAGGEVVGGGGEGGAVGPLVVHLPDSAPALPEYTR